ncbi:MAG: hypothetical protein EHM80_15940 [Nitrospiraceae bacterium]|nr:MAG: hypothetical protein EHM80_15940 [Nitrospiraceae bacterium]
MKVVDNLAMLAALWPILALSIVPLLSMFLSSRECDPIDFSIKTTNLVWIDLHLKPPGVPIPHDLFNRTLGTLVLWGVALGLTHGKPVREGLISAETI